VIGLGGEVKCNADSELHQWFDVLMAIQSEVADLDLAMRNTEANLIRTSQALGNLLALNFLRMA
jgi:hypothetical protein